MRRALVALSRSQHLAEFAAESRIAWLGARRFVSGKTLEEAFEVVRRLNAAGLAVTLDRLGEHASDPAEAERSRDAICEILERVSASGVRSGLSVKLTQLGLDFSCDLARRLLRDVVDRAAGQNPPVYVRIDMEDSPYVQATLDLLLELHGEYRNLGAVIQSYLYRSARDIERLVENGVGVRIVKGAYVEPPDIAYQDKRDVDSAYIRYTERLLSSDARARGVYAAVATHDEAIIDWVKEHVVANRIPPDAFEFQMLYGIRRDLQSSLVREGYRVRVYVPFGRQWYAYYMRRIAEEPQNIIWVTKGVLRELTAGR